MTTTPTMHDWKAERSRTIASPRPEPCAASSARTPRRMTASRIEGSIPGPSSSTAITIRSPSLEQVSLTRARAHLQALSSRLPSVSSWSSLCPRKACDAGASTIMTDNPINLAGIEIPSDSLGFLAALGVHVLFGLSCVGAGVGAMLSRKRLGRHPRFGTIYYYCLSVVFASATVLSAMRWAEDYHLFILGTISFTTASLGRMALRRRWRNRIRLHITCMGLSYILVLTAFYVDNGKNLPLWNKLPQTAFWVLPAAVGIPLIIRALLRHPLVRSYSTTDASSKGKTTIKS